MKVVDQEESPVMPEDIDSLKQHALILHSHKSGLWRINPDSKERDKAVLQICRIYPPQD